MKIFRPSENPITQSYSATHRGYDFGGNNLPDAVRASQDGVIVERVDSYNTNWRNTGALTTRDYGNYIKVRHTDGTHELHAHLRQGSALLINTRVKAGQIIARIGNTGNSTGPHLHYEFRNSSNQVIPVEFIQGGGGVDVNELDKVRKERDDNWNLYQKALKDQDALRKARDDNWNSFQASEQKLKDHKCPVIDPKATEAVSILNAIKAF